MSMLGAMGQLGKQLGGSRAVLVTASVLALIALLAIVGPLFSPYSYLDSNLDEMIDHLVGEATGQRREDLSRFVDWFTEAVWGADMDPRTES